MRSLGAGVSVGLAARTASVVEQVASLESVGILELAATAVGLGAAQAAESAAKLRLVLPARRVEAA